MAIRPLSIPALQERNPIVDEQRRPVVNFIRSLNSAFRQIQQAFNENADVVQQLAELAGLVNAQGDIIEAQGEVIEAQQETIVQLQEQQETAESDASLANSGVVQEAGSFTIDDSGNINIPDHSRQYGNPTLNPSVAVTSGSVTVTGTAGQSVYVFYDDAGRAGGAVTYQASTDAADGLQRGGRHSVGTAFYPSTGTEDGFFTRPR